MLTAEAEQAVVVGEDERVKSAMEEGRHDLRKLRVGQTGIDCPLRYIVNHATAGHPTLAHSAVHINAWLHVPHTEARLLLVVLSYERHACMHLRCS